MFDWKKKQGEKTEQATPAIDPAAPRARRRRRRVIPWSRPSGTRIYPAPEREESARLGAYARDYWRKKDG
jgi:hypothetical protein